MQQATRPTKNCADCPTPIERNRKRCEPCAYQAILADNLRRYHAKSTTGQPKTSTVCQAQYTPPRMGPSKYCDTCRHAKQLQSKRQCRLRNPAPRAPMSRPCPTCGTAIPRSGKVYAKHCSDDCKPRCSVPGCDRPFKYKTEQGLLCPNDYMAWQTNGTFLRKWEWESQPGICRQCGAEMADSIPGLGWICSSRCHGRRSLKISEAETWKCVSCPAMIERRHSRSDTKLCGLCRRSRRPAMSAHQLAERDGTDCGICGEAVDMTLSGIDYWGPTADHMIPVSRGGPDVPENLQLAHRACNCWKLDRII